MAGFLVSVLRVTDRPDWLACLDSPTAAPAWPRVLAGQGGGPRLTPARLPTPLPPQDQDSGADGPQLPSAMEAVVRAALAGAAAALIEMEDELNLLDSGAGDGDCGSTLAGGARALQAALPGLTFSRPLQLLAELAALAEQMGGSSGGLYSLLFTAAGRAFARRAGGAVETADWVSGLELGLAAVCEYGGAEPGDRTMLDALQPALLALQAGLPRLEPAALQEVAAAARAGAAATRGMKARAGRASYVAAEKVTQEDPGAVAAAAWISAVIEAVSE